MTHAPVVSPPASGPFGGRARGGRWWWLVFAAIWLIFLQEPVQDAWAIRGTPRGTVALVALVVFGALYLGSFGAVRQRRMAPAPHRRGTGLAILAGMAILSALVCWAVGQSGTATFVYVAVTAVMSLPVRVAFAVTVGLALLHEVLVRAVTGWEEQPSLTFSLLTAALAMFGVRMLMDRNQQLLNAREELADLAVAEERNRFSRDLHDILGHTLTVVTVKAELAGRLLDVDPERARAELADVERLSRDALADVRRAVGGYRELSLAAELVRAREALRSAGIADDLPTTVDEVPAELRELFAWTIREGVTNVVRHSRATRCTVRLGRAGVAVEDDGEGPGGTGPGDGSIGHGLTGLRERAVAEGAVLMTSTVAPHGFRLEVTRG
ncbi:MAG: histidine kinase [Gemmatimonadales bacterium]|nr:histidine kinase [Gemmatimonadales bacterium]